MLSYRKTRSSRAGAGPKPDGRTRVLFCFSCTELARIYASLTRESRDRFTNVLTMALTEHLLYASGVQRPVIQVPAPLTSKGCRFCSRPHPRWWRGGPRGPGLGILLRRLAPECAGRGGRLLSPVSLLLRDKPLSPDGHRAARGLEPAGRGLACTSPRLCDRVAVSCHRLRLSQTGRSSPG